MEADALLRALDLAARPLRGLSGLARLLVGLAAAVAVLALTAWLARAGVIETPIWVLVAWLLIGVLLMLGVWLARRAIAALGPWHVGAQLEQSGAWRQGAITTVLDSPAEGTSGALHTAALRMRAAEVGERGTAVLAPAIERQRTLSRRATVVLALAAAGLAAARPATGTAAQLWHPVAAWRAMVAPVQLAARHAVVARGEAAVLDIAVVGRRHVTLYTRAAGEAWRPREVALDANGRATVTTAPLTADLVARVGAGARFSPDVHVAIRLAAFLGAFTATAHYPAYLGLEDEALPTGGDTLVVPEGTRLSLSGRATTPLAVVRIVGPSGAEPLSVAGMNFRGDLTPRVSGDWRLRITSGSGAELEGEMPSLPLRIVPDSAPTVEIPVPGVDTIASAAMSLALVVGIRDDHGISGAELETRRGGSGTVTRTPLSLAPGGGDRALVTMSLDLAGLGLKAGDTLRYTAVARDNAPAHHVGRSREFVVRIPTEIEQRAARARETAQASTAFDSLSKQAARVQRTEEDLARERQRTDPLAGNNKGANDGQRDPLASDAARKAEAAAQAQQQVLDDAAKLQQAVRELRDAAAREGVADSSLTRELDEINKLLDKALSPELRDKLAALKDAVKALDAERTRASLEDLAKQQAQLKEAMDQARELFKRAALETDLANMAQDAKSLASEQHALTEQFARNDSGGARAEQQLAKRTDSLAAGLDRAAAQVPAPQPQAGLQQAGQQARSAAAKMRAAAQSSQQGKPGEAQQEGKQAEEQLNPLSKQIDDDRTSMQAEMRAAVKQALDRALAETARLAQRQLDVVQQFGQGALLPQARQAQGLIEEGAGKLAQQIAAVSAMNALVSPQAAVAFAQARQLMRDAITAAAAANPNARDAFEKSGDAVDQLAIAAYSLLQSKDKVDGSQSGSGVQEAMEQMKEMAGKQGQLAQQGAGMMQSAATAQQVMQMAMQQRALAQQLERMRAAGQLPGAGQMAREAKDLSATMEGGRLNQDVVDRQQTLFKRMLDAGRTLQGDEDDEKKERQSTTAKAAPAAIPPALDPRIRDGRGEIRLPSWESLQRLSPDARRQVVEYFQRLTQGGPP